MKTPYSALLAEFQDAILTHKLPAAGGMFCAKPGFPPEAQLSVYSTGYRLRLMDVVREDYPALRYYLGDDMFDNLALQYIEATPSQHFNIEKYPWRFAAFVAAHSPDQFAHELAVLEQTISEVYRMEESEPANPALLATIAPEDLGDTRFPLRTAHRLLAFNRPVNAYLEAFRNNMQPALPTAQPEYVAVWRHHNTVRRLALEAGEHTLLSVLASGCTLGEAFAHPQFSPYIEEAATRMQKWFEHWLANGMIAAC